MHELFSQPRVYISKDWKWKGGPQNFGRKIINPQAVKVAQSIEAHLDVYAPGGYGQKHGHMNSAVFFVLKGKGHDVHDGKRLDWEAGDALIIENGCVHQHFNDDPDDESIVLIMKAKPLFLFMHMLFQKVVSYPPKDPTPGQKNYKIEHARAHAATQQVDFYAKALQVSERFRGEYKERLNVVKAAQMPFERSPDGLIKHIIHEDMNTKECASTSTCSSCPPARPAASTAT